MRGMQQPTWLLLLLLLLLLLIAVSAGERRRQQRNTGLTSAVPALRSSLQEVRQQLREPHISYSLRRKLKRRKRRLREELRVQRAERRRERRRRRRLKAQRDSVWPAVTAREPAVESSGSGHLEDAEPHRFTAGDERRPAAERRGDRLTAAEADQRLLDGEQLLRGQPAADGDVVESAGLAGGSVPPAADGEAAFELGTSQEREEEEEAAAGGGFLSSLWDWVAPSAGTEPEPGQEPKLKPEQESGQELEPGHYPELGPEQEPEVEPEQEPQQEPEQEPEQDAGWTVPPLPDGRRPNIVLIMTDDLDVELGSLNYMPKLRRFLQDEGVTFRHGYVSTPLCCPSRSSYLTGMFVHNHQVYTNRDNCSNALWQQTHEQRTYAAYLQSAGYRTGHFGKYMNRYDGEHIPAGWHHWSSLIFNSKYYNYSMNVNGVRREHGWQYPKDYLPSIIVNESLTFFERTRREYAADPVLMVMSFPGPHGPEDAAPQYTNLFLNATEHHTPAYDFAPSADKQWFLRHVGKMDAVERTFTDLLMTKRLQTLQSIDDGIEQLHRRLTAAGELDSTYIVFTSDHGYHLGQFGLPKGKSYPFEFDIRVPFVVRGPGVRAGSRSRDAVLNVDVAPTLLQMAGLTPPPHMDGRSLLPLLAATDRPAAAASPPWPDTFIVEGAGRRPDQRVNRRLQQGAVRTDDKHVLYVSALQRLQEVCSQPEYSSPCRPYQRWACYHDGRRWRLQKCRRRAQHAPLLCPCRDGVVQRTRRIRDRERHDQLRFLQEHLEGDVRHVRFVKELRQRRQRRAASDSQLVKQFVVEQDASHVDDDIRRIGYELQILQSHVGSVGRCAVDNTTCVTPDPHSRRRLVDDQIRRLQQLLKQLKSIRRHLTGLAPRRGSGRSSAAFEEGDFVDYPDGAEDGDLMTAGDTHTAPPAGRGAPSKTVAEAAGSADVAFCPCRPLDDRAERQWVREYTKQARREEKAQRRRDRRKQKRRKQRKKERLASQNCNFEGLNCFVHDNDHWKTPPLWTHGPVCICLGASNGTFDCLRSVGGDGADNWLYCRFITGFLSFYDLTVDPYQLHNLAPTMAAPRLQRLDARLAEMQGCRGPDQCRPLPGGRPSPTPPGPAPPGDQPGPAVPGDQPGPAVPGDQPGPAVPGDQPGSVVPGDQPGPVVPGDQPGSAPPALPPAPPVAQAVHQERRPGVDRTGLSRHVRRRRQRTRARRIEWLQYRRRLSSQG